MLIKIFFLGRPGSGKSTAARHMIELAERRNYATLYIRDYDILYQMFQEDHDGEQFRPAAYDGFDVLDKTAFDTALLQLEEDILALPRSEKKQLAIIEFARDNYHNALNLFKAEFLRSSYLFFVDADLDVCIKRIHKRVETPSEPDHHFVSDYIMQTYYDTDNWMYVSSLLQKEYPFFKHIAYVRNTELLPDLLACVNNFADMVFLHESKQGDWQENSLTDLHTTADAPSPQNQEEYSEHVPDAPASTSVIPRHFSAAAYTQYTNEQQRDPVVLAP